MTGHIDQAADALTQAGDQVPVEQALQAQQQMATVIAYLGHVGGVAGESLATTATRLEADLGAHVGRLHALRQDLINAASRYARQAGAGGQSASSSTPAHRPAGSSSGAPSSSTPAQPSPEPRTWRSPAEAALIAEAKAAGHKINADEVVRIGRTSAGRLVWLEKGGEQARLGHIMTAERVADFQRAGVDADSIVDLVFHAATTGRPIGIVGKDRPVYAVTFQGREHRVAVTVGSNGYIVGAAPMSQKGKLKPLP